MLVFLIPFKRYKNHLLNLEQGIKAIQVGELPGLLSSDLSLEGHPYGHQDPDKSAPDRSAIRCLSRVSVEIALRPMSCCLHVRKTRLQEEGAKWSMRFTQACPSDAFSRPWSAFLPQAEEIYLFSY